MAADPGHARYPNLLAPLKVAHKTLRNRANETEHLHLIRSSQTVLSSRHRGKFQCRRDRCA